MSRKLLIAVSALTALAVATPSAIAGHVPPRFYSLGVPARDDVPASARLYASLGGAGNRLGDPVILATRNRGTYNPRSDWMPIDPRYPNLPEEVVTGVAEGQNIRCYLIICGGTFSGPPGVFRPARSKLVNRYSGKCLTVSGVVAHAAPIIQQTCRPSDPKQTWHVTVNRSDTRFAIEPVFWYQYRELRCLGPAFRSAGRQLTVHRRLRSTETCPHWVLKYSSTTSWRQPFVRPF